MRRRSDFARQGGEHHEPMLKKEKWPEGSNNLIEKDLKARIDELTALYEVSKTITSSANLDKMLRLITRKIRDITKSDICMIHLVEKEGLVLKTSYGIGKARALKGRFVLNNGAAARAIMTKKVIRLDGTTKGRFLNSLLVVPLVAKEEAIGTLTCYCKKSCAYTKENEEEVLLFANQAAAAVRNARMFEEIRMNYLNTMKLLASIIDAKDTYTEYHSERVMKTALGIANIMGLSDKQKSVVRYASLLHDIGKIGVDISILKKPGLLSKKEWVKMKRHPVIAANIIKKAGFLDDLVPAILYHHVKYSGGGYPATKKKGRAIPIEARILAVADAYEAMRSDRPYRKRLSIDQTAAEFKRCSGTQFDPNIVKAFFKYSERL